MIKDRFTKQIFFRLWYPSLIAAIGMSAADMADAIVIGQKMGATGLAAVALCLPIFMLINMVMIGFALGGSAQYSAYMAQGQRKEAQRCYNDTMRSALVISVIIAVFGNIFIDGIVAALGASRDQGTLYEITRDYARVIIGGAPLFFLNFICNYYLRNDNRQKLASAGSVIAAIADVALSAVLVLVFNLGAVAAAWATIIGQGIAVVVYLPGLLSRETYLKFDRERICWKNAFDYFRSGFSVSCQYLYQLIFFILTNNIIMRSIGENGAAAFDLIQNASYLLIYLYEGTAKAMQPLVSTYCGECNKTGMRGTFRLGLRASTAVAGVLVVFIFVYPGAMCRLFGLYEETVYNLGCYVLRVYCLGAFVAGVNILIENYEQACGRSRNAIAMATMRGLTVLIPCMLIFSVMGKWYLWFMHPATEIISLGLFFLWRHFRGERERLRSDHVFYYTITNTNSEISDISEIVLNFCTEKGVAMKKAYFVSMAVEEICVAIMDNGFSEKGRGFIQVSVVVMDEDNVEIHIRDNADKFDPFSMEAGEKDEDGFDFGTMGMDIIRMRSKDFFYRQYQGFNTLVVKV